MSRPALRLLLIDNYDSFTYNLAHAFGSLGAELTVLRNDDAGLNAEAIEGHDALCLGPGPGRPAQAGRMPAAIGWALEARRPLLGVCLGLQAIGEHYGGVVSHAPGLMHGKTSPISHDGSGVFLGLPSPFDATRYHSLCLAHAPFPAELRANAASEDGVVQGVVHRELPVYGVQFHPESILTVEGSRLCENFMALARPG